MHVSVGKSRKQEESSDAGFQKNQKHQVEDRANTALYGSLREVVGMFAACSRANVQLYKVESGKT